MANASIAQWSLSPGVDPPATMPGEGASLKRIAVAAGFKGERHSHPHEQFVLVVSGAGQLECEGEAGSVAL